MPKCSLPPPPHTHLITAMNEKKIITLTKSLQERMLMRKIAASGAHTGLTVTERAAFPCHYEPGHEAWQSRVGTIKWVQDSKRRMPT